LSFNADFRVAPTEQPVEDWGMAPQPYKEPTEQPVEDWGMAPQPYKEPTEQPVEDWGMAPQPYKEPTEQPVEDWGMAPQPYKEPTEQPALAEFEGWGASRVKSPVPVVDGFNALYAGLTVLILGAGILIIVYRAYCRRKVTTAAPVAFSTASSSAMFDPSELRQHKLSAKE
jgi:hypothetical protein